MFLVDKKTIFPILLLMLGMSAVWGGGKKEDPDTLGKEEPGTLAHAIQASAKTIETMLPQGTQTAVLSFKASSQELSNYIIEQLPIALVANKKIKVIDRQHTDLIRKELNIQKSGEVSNDEVKKAGEQLGAQYIITGSLVDVGNEYTFSVIAIDVVTALHEASASLKINIDDPQVFYLLTGERQPVPNTGGVQTAQTGNNAIDPDPQLQPPLVKFDPGFSLGPRIGGSPGFYTLSDDVQGDVDAAASFDIAIQAAFRMVTFPRFFDSSLSVQTELAFAMDNVAYTTNDGSDTSASFKSASLIIPLLAKVTFPFTDRFGISLFTGPYVTIPLTQMDYSGGGVNASYDFSVPMGLMVGVDGGWKLGPGVLFADFRFAADFGNTSISDNSGILAIYQRNALSVSLGYEWLFGQHK